MRNIDLRDLSLLAELVKGEHFTKLTGLAISGFNLDRNRNAIYRRLLFLEAKGFVSQGFPMQKANRYFITQKGIKFYEEAIS